MTKLWHVYTELFRNSIQHRHLIFQLIHRDILGRYRGSTLGLLWPFLIPLIMLGIYTFVFSSVFQSRWGNGTIKNTTSFSILLFVGLVFYNMLADCLTRAPVTITSSPSYVKKIVFPLEILSYVTVGSALFHTLINILILLGAIIFTKGVTLLSLIFFPLLMIPFILMMLGISWILAALGVFMRDINQLIGLVLMGFMFMSPIFYPLTALPEKYRSWVELNPMTYFIEEGRNILIEGNPLNFSKWFMALFLSFNFAALGLGCFKKLRRAFADVL